MKSEADTSGIGDNKMKITEYRLHVTVSYNYSDMHNRYATQKLKEKELRYRKSSFRLPTELQLLLDSLYLQVHLN